MKTALTELLEHYEKIKEIAPKQSDKDMWDAAIKVLKMYFKKEEEIIMNNAIDFKNWQSLYIGHERLRIAEIKDYSDKNAALSRLSNQTTEQLYLIFKNR